MPRKRKTSLHLNKIQLDNYSTYIGLIGAIAVILSQYDFIPEKWGGMIGAVCAAIVSYFVQKPATEAPNTEDLEQ